MTGIDFEKKDDTLFVRALGERLDGTSQILQTLEENDLLKEPYKRVVLDLARVEFINSLGITELVDMQRRLTNHMQRKTILHFKNVDRKVNAILELVEFHRVAEISIKEEDEQE